MNVHNSQIPGHSSPVYPQVQPMPSGSQSPANDVPRYPTVDGFAGVAPQQSYAQPQPQPQQFAQVGTFPSVPNYPSAQMPMQQATSRPSRCYWGTGVGCTLGLVTALGGGIGFGMVDAPGPAVGLVILGIFMALSGITIDLFINRARNTRQPVLPPMPLATY